MFSQTRVRDKLLHALPASVLPPSHLSPPRPPLLHENLHSECPVARPHSSKWAEFAEPPAGDCKGTDMERNVESGRRPRPREERSQATTEDYSLPGWGQYLERGLRKKAGPFISFSYVANSWDFCKE